MIFFPDKTSRKTVIRNSGLFALCVLFAFFIRSAICDREISQEKILTGNDFAPFQVESAMMYSYVNAVADGKSISGIDPGLVGMSEYTVAEQMSLGLEYYLGWGIRTKRLLFNTPAVDPKNSACENNPADTAQMRSMLRFWVCFIPGFIFLWLIFAGCPWPLAIFGSALYAVAPAAVARYTGQDLLKGEFGLPFLVAAFAFAQFSANRKTIAGLLLTGLAIFCATAFWDAPQLCIGLWGVLEILRLATKGEVSANRRHLFITVYVAMVLSAVLIPYNRAHAFILSPVILAVWPTLIALCFLRFSNLKKRLATVIIVCIFFAVIWQTISSNSRFAGNYSHFSSLTVAKLKFFNVKPENPTHLNFEQRFLWTPSLDSATLPLTLAFYPAALWMLLMLGATGLCLKKIRRQMLANLERSLLPLTMTFIFFVLYIFFVRFHVFCAVFMCVALPLLFHDWFSAVKNITMKVILTSAILLTFACEAGTTYVLKREYSETFLKSTGTLIKWFRAADVKNKTILADMQISPLLKGYCNAAILIQPKFELAPVRQAVKRYIELMFHRPELDLAEFCEKNRIDFLVFTRGMATAPMHIYSYRYMAAAAALNPTAPAFKMDTKPQKMTFFYELPVPPEYRDANLQYRVFKTVFPSKRKTAADTAELAIDYLKQGNLPLARKLARAAYLTDPISEKTYLTYYKVFRDIPSATLQDYTK